MGFGDKEEEKPVKKCIFGKACDREYPHYKECKIHQWRIDHDEAWLAIKIGLGILIGIIVLIGVISVLISIDNSVAEPVYQNIERFGCTELAEYIADKNERYSYAEHRYTWLCVNESVKEFQR